MYSAFNSPVKFTSAVSYSSRLVGGRTFFLIGSARSRGTTGCGCGHTGHTGHSGSTVSAGGGNESPSSGSADWSGTAPGEAPVGPGALSEALRTAAASTSYRRGQPWASFHASSSARRWSITRECEWRSLASLANLASSTARFRVSTK